MLQKAEAARQQRFEAGKDKMSEVPSAPDTDPDAYATMMLSAPQTPGRGSALAPADFLASVLSNSSESSRLTEGLSADMRPEEFTAAKVGQRVCDCVCMRMCV